MNLGKLFLFTDKAIHYAQDGVEVAIIPGMNTVRGRGHGFRFDAALSEIDFHVGEKAVLTHQGGASGVGFTFSLPDTVAKQIIEKRNEHMRQSQKRTDKCHSCGAVTDADDLEYLHGYDRCPKCYQALLYDDVNGGGDDY